MESVINDILKQNDAKKIIEQLNAAQTFNLDRQSNPNILSLVEQVASNNSTLLKKILSRIEELDSANFQTNLKKLITKQNSTMGDRQAYFGPMLTAIASENKESVHILLEAVRDPDFREELFTTPPKFDDYKRMLGIVSPNKHNEYDVIYIGEENATPLVLSHKRGEEVLEAMLNEDTGLFSLAEHRVDDIVLKKVNEQSFIDYLIHQEDYDLLARCMSNMTKDAKDTVLFQAIEKLESLESDLQKQGITKLFNTYETDADKVAALDVKVNGVKVGNILARPNMQGAWDAFYDTITNGTFKETASTFKTEMYGDVETPSEDFIASEPESQDELFLALEEGKADAIKSIIAPMSVQERQDKLCGNTNIIYLALKKLEQEPTNQNKQNIVNYLFTSLDKDSNKLNALLAGVEDESVAQILKHPNLQATKNFIRDSFVDNDYKEQFNKAIEDPAHTLSDEFGTYLSQQPQQPQNPYQGLIDALNSYVTDRNKEDTHTGKFGFFSKMFGYNKDAKVNAARALIENLKGPGSTPLQEHKGALRQGSLGKLIRDYVKDPKNQMPKYYKNVTSEANKELPEKDITGTTVRVNSVHELVDLLSITGTAPEVKK